MPGGTAWMLSYAVFQLNSTAPAKSNLVTTATSALSKMVGYLIEFEVLGPAQTTKKPLR